MLKIFYTFLFMTATILAGAQNNQKPVKIMSFNIRYDAKSDIAGGDGWDDRRKYDVLALLKHYEPDLFGVQEAIKHQIDYLLENLPEYDFIGVGRNEGTMEGEFSAIFYKKDRFTPETQQTFWLSETPEKPSKSWDAALPRIVTWGHFKDKDNSDSFYYFNTHFDHRGKQARVESAKLIVEKIKSIAGDAPVALTGDMNARPDSKPYQILAEALKDAAKISEKPAYGPEGTFSGFDLKPDKNFPRIDYVFVKQMKVHSYETIADFRNDKFPSDHLPVMATVTY